MPQKVQNIRHVDAPPAGLVRPALVSAFLFMAIAGLAYPLVTTGVAQLLFHYQAQGDIISRNGVDVGSEVIGQWCTKPRYFHPRPSVTTGTDPNDSSKTVDQPYNAANSGGSNLAPTSKKLIDAVTSRTEDYRKENGLGPTDPVPVDAVTASGSGLDPDISVENARLQARRVAAAWRIPEQEVLTLLDAHTQGPQFGLLGYPRVSVLNLNIALDNQTPRFREIKGN
jgi:potassium-transporting ATPase KdpC subunit